jgi:DNA-binding MltR family transcriptional regulator
MIDGWDEDIGAMNLTPVEKNGLQVYRNYTKAFTKSARDEFIASADRLQIPLDDLSMVLVSVAKVEARAVPVIACAYADDILKAMFRREIPEGVPGGKNDLLNGMGPLGRFSQRIQMAFAINWIRQDLLLELHQMRKLRNEISHQWDVSFLESRLVDVVRNQTAVEETMGILEGFLGPRFWENLDHVQKLRVRTVWILGRLFGESHLWAKAIKARLEPDPIFYGDKSPRIMVEMAVLCITVIRKIINRE